MNTIKPHKVNGRESFGTFNKTLRVLFYFWIFLIIASLIFWQEPIKTAYSLIIIPFIYIITKLQGGSAVIFASGQVSAFHAIYIFALIAIPVVLILIKILKKRF